MRCVFRLVECNLHFFFSAFQFIYLFACINASHFFFSLKAIYKKRCAESALCIPKRKFLCHLWSRWQTESIFAFYIWSERGEGCLDDDVEREGEEIDKQFASEIMERKHGFNCNIMHESVFNDAQQKKTRKPNGKDLVGNFSSQLLAPFGKFIALKCGELRNYFNFKHQVVKWHQSLIIGRCFVLKIGRVIFVAMSREAELPRAGKPDRSVRCRSFPCHFFPFNYRNSQ